MNKASTDSQSSPQVFYEVAMNRLDAQMNRLEAIDRKLASLIGFASVIIAIFAAALQLGEAAQLPLCAIALLGLAGATYIALMVFALRAYRFKKWDFRPNLKKLDEYCKKYGDSIMRDWVARECLCSYGENEEKLSSKTSNGRKAMWLLAIETTLLIIAAVLALVL